METEQGPKDASPNISKKLNGIEFKEVSPIDNLTFLIIHFSVLCSGVKVNKNSIYFVETKYSLTFNEEIGYCAKTDAIFCC